MKTKFIVASYIIGVVCIGCSSRSTDQTDADSTAVQTEELNNSEAESSNTRPEIDYIENIDSITYRQLLRWKAISFSEYGPSYEFETESGKFKSFKLIQIPDFDFEKNEYFDVKYSDESTFPIITLKPETLNRFYSTTIKTETREMYGVEAEMEIIISMTLVAGSNQ